MAKRELIQINVSEVLRTKLGGRARFIPKWLVRWLEKTVCQDELNELLMHNYPKTGAEFCDGVLSDLDVKVSLAGDSQLPPPENKRIILVCNHPLGGLDGMALISLLTHYYGAGLKVVVNDILMAVEPLRDVFLPINKHGSQNRESIDAINSAMSSDMPILIFPAGLVSRMGKKGEIKDLEWHKMFVAKAVQYKRDVLPIYFSGNNSSFFYKFARRRKRLGMKLNIEMVYLPREVVRSRGKSFEVRVGKLIPWQEFAQAPSALQKAQEIKEMVYSLKQ